MNSQTIRTTARRAVGHTWLPHRADQARVACAVIALALGIGPVVHAADTAAGAQPRSAVDETDRAEPLLMLGVGDAVSVQVYGKPELSTTAYVSDDGTIPIPLAGSVQVAGQSPAKAAQSIATAFRKGRLLVDPQVTVFLVQSRSQQVSVLGAVRTPGRFAIDSGMTVLDVVAQAGGVAENGGSTVVVMRADKAGAVTRHIVDLRGLNQADLALPTLTLRGGDSIFVPAAEQFSIYGEVNAPNSYRLEPGMTVVEAISRSGGVTPRGSRNRIEVRRVQPDGGFVTRSASLDDEIQPNDVIRVKERLF